MNDNPYELRQANEGQTQGQSPVVLPTQVVERQVIKKPKSVTVFGVLSCIFGGLGILFALVVFGGMVINEFVEKVNDVNKMKTFFVASLWLFMSVWQVTTGIGLLAFVKWARKWSIYYAFVDFAWTLVVLGAARGPSFNLIGFIYPALLLIFMNTEKVRQAFEMLENPKS
jgi:hypothetical protein